MKCFNQIIALLLLINSIFTHALTLSSEQEERDFSVCDEIKKLDVRTSSDEDFENYIEKLLQNNLSLCDCMRYISNKRVQNALEAIMKKENMTSEQRIEQKALLAMEIEYEKHLAPRVTFPKEIAPACQELIKKKVQDFHMSIPLEVVINNELDSPAAVERGTDAYLLYINKKLSKNQLNLEDFDAILEHEFTHIKNKDHIITDILFSQVNKKQKFLHSKSLTKYYRAREARADREAQACCMNLETVKNIKNCLRKFATTAAKSGINITEKNEQSAYSPYYTRLLWAYKIAKLRFIEADKYKKT